MEADEQQVNLTRFSLFFPEKRQFFIEGADSLRMGVGLLHFGPPPLELFYSRNIGLSNQGTPITIPVGGKLTGKIGGFDVGVLTAQTSDTNRQSGENFTVGRVRKEILGRSYIGAIATNRQGGGVRNTVLGVDGRFTFFNNLNIMGLAARSEDDRGATASAPAKAQWATQLGAEWRDDFFEAGANYLDVDPNFNAGIGYVRARERMIGVRGSLKPRPKRWNIRQFELTPSSVWYHDVDRVLRSRDTNFTFATAFQSGDRIELVPSDSYERVVRPFAIGPGTTVKPGAEQGEFLRRRQDHCHAVGRPAAQQDAVAQPELSNQRRRAVGRRVCDAPLRPARQRLVFNEPADVGLRAVQQHRATGGHAGPAQLHLPDHRQRLPGLQRDPLHRWSLRRPRQPVAGPEGYLLPSSLVSATRIYFF